MGIKADRRATRIAAAQARDAAFEQRGATDAKLLARLSSMPDDELQRVRDYTLRNINRPSYEHSAGAHAVFGALKHLGLLDGVKLPGLVGTVNVEESMLVRGEALSTELGTSAE